MNTNSRFAFSLVELSIVLVILGLLAGGIMTGQNLIHAAQLRRIGTDIDKYKTAITMFQYQYMHLPGELRKHAQFFDMSAWPAQHLNCTASTDGHESCAPSGKINGGIEVSMVMPHLSKAGLIEHAMDWNGLAWPESRQLVIKSNIPPGAFGITGYHFTYGFPHPNNDNANWIRFAGEHQHQHWTGTTDFLPSLPPVDAYTLDKKFDDGVFETGHVQSNGAANKDAIATQYGVNHMHVCRKNTAEIMQISNDACVIGFRFD